MRSYTLKRVNGAPDWNTIDIMPIDTVMWMPNPGISAQAQMCWDDEAIYVRMKTVEENIRAVNTGLLDDVCQDSCLEFFIRPTEDMRYFNLEFNLNCALYLGFGSNMENLVRLVVQDKDAIFAPKAQRNEDGWEIAYRIPFSFIRHFFPDYAPKAGMQFYGNCYKCGDLTVQEHYLSWNPLTSPTPSYHRPWDYGRLIFGE